jgi:predicted TIM-barrel fold metal-dependent hydrolase
MFDRAPFRSRLGGCPCCITSDIPGAAVPTISMASAGASGGTSPRAQGHPAAVTGARRIDVHHHVAPPKWLAEAIGRDLLQPATRNWSVEKSIEDMDRGDVAAAAVSVTNPGLWFGDVQQSRRLARDSNEFMAGLVRDRPARFAFFAATPMPDVEGTLAEISYALDTLHADGIGLFTSYRDIWLGNDVFEPVMEELNRRKALVFVHPTAAACCMNLIPDVAPGMIEYGTDTTRAILGILCSGQAVRFPHIRFIWSHAGGSAPFFAGRIEDGVPRLKDHQTRLPHGAIHEMKKFYYDIAGAANRGAIMSLRELVSASQILFGTDYPSGTSSHIIAGLAKIGFAESDLTAINRGNAAKLLPRLGS